MNDHTPSINLKELSFLTGFSVSTVSKALNDKYDISKKTKRLIHSVAKEHNYVPNRFAAGLRNKKSFTVAIILPQINVSFYSDLLFHFQKIAERQGYRIVVFQSFEEKEKEMDYLQRIGDGSIDGSILITSTKNHDYASRYALPITPILIEKVLGQANLKEYCYQVFYNLIFKIS